MGHYARRQETGDKELHKFKFACGDGVEECGRRLKYVTE